MADHKFTVPPSNGGYARGCRCQACLGKAREYQRAYRRKFPEKIKDWGAKRRIRHKARHPGIEAEYQKRYRERYPERSKASFQQWKDAHPNAMREANRRHVSKHKDRINARARQRRKDGLDKVDHVAMRAYQKQYRQTEKGKRVRRIGWHAYRTRKRGAKGFATVDQVKARWDFYGGLCYMCHAKAGSIDHVIPLSRGGSNWPANLRPACAHCNSTKRSRKPHEMAARDAQSAR